MAHWGGPVRYLDTSRATQKIVLKASEKKAIIDHLDNKITEEQLTSLFYYLQIREIVDIDFSDTIE